MESEKEQEIEVEATRVDENLGIDKNEVAEKSKKERVKVEEPKNVTCSISLDVLNLIFSIASIALVMFAKLFAVISVVVAFQVFYWLGVAALFGSLAIFVVQIFKDKKVAFNPSFVMLVVAVIACTF